MAELKNTYVNGSLSAHKIYEAGKALENKYGASLAFSSNKIQLKDATGTVISEATLPTGAYSATTTNSVTAPKVAITTAATGFTASSTATSYYVTVSETPTNGSVKSTATAKIDTAGYLAAGSKSSGTDTDTITPTVTIDSVSETSKKIYIPAGGCTVAGGTLSGGGLTIKSNYSGTPTVTVVSGSDTNMANITIGAQDTTNYPYYFKATGSSSALSGTTKVERAAVTRAAVTDTHTAGYIPAKSATTVIAADSSTIAADSKSPTVTVNAGSGSAYVGLKAATFAVSGRTVYCSGAGYVPKGSTSSVLGTIGAGTIDVTDLTITPNALTGAWDSTNNKYVVSQAKKTATMQSTVTTAGYVSSSVGTKNTGTATVNAPTSLSIPKAAFSATNGDATLTVAENSTAVSGATNIAGYMGAPTTTKPTSGHFYAFNVSSTGTGSISTTSSGAGYMPASTSAGSVTVSKGATTYYSAVTTDTPEFDGGALSGGTLSKGTASGGGLTATGSNVTLSETNNGIAVTVNRAAFSQKVTRAAVARAAVLYKGAVAGFVSVNDDAVALPKNDTALAADSTGQTVSLGAGSITRYITDINIPSKKVLNVTMSAGGETTTEKTTLLVTTAAHSVVDINDGVLIGGANGKTVTIGTTTVTDANGALTKTSRSASTGYVTLTAGAGSVSGSGVTLSTSNTSGISVTGSGTVTGTGYGKVSTGTGWVTSGTTSSKTSSSESKTSNTATKYVTDISVGSGKTLNSVTNSNGTITTITVGDGSGSSTGKIGTITLNGVSTVPTGEGVYIDTLYLSGVYTTIKNVYGTGSLNTLAGSQLATYTNKGDIVTISNAGTIGTITNKNVISSIVNNSSKNITTISNKGIIKTIDNTGRITTLKGSGSITNFESALNISNMKNNVTIDSHTSGEMNYCGWKLSQDAGGNLVMDYIY